MLMYSPTLGRDVDISDYFVTDDELEGLMRDWDEHYADMAPGIRRQLESLIRANR